MRNMFFFFLAVIFLSCSKQVQQDEWRYLFNERDLTGWNTYLGPLYSEEKGDFDGPPVGLNNDPYQVFTVMQEGDKGILHISGEVFGGISTVDSFENFHLQVQFKWGEAKYKPRDKDKRDSGVLYHGRGAQGSEWFFWLKSQEFQVQEGDCGDYWPLQSEVDIRATMNPDSSYRFDPQAEPVHFGKNSDLHNAKKFPDGMEKPNGQWNTLDLYSLGQTSLHVVNGTLVMRLENSREIIDGKEIPVTQGKIQIQSEGAEVFYRGIKIKPISALPEL